MLAILRTAGATALLVTHDQDEALSMSDRRRGHPRRRDRAVRQPAGLYAHPVDADLAHFVGDVNLLAGQLRRRRPSAPHSGGWRCRTIAAAAQQRRGRDRDGPTRAAAAVAGRAEQPGACEVVDHEFYGHDAIVRLKPLHPSGEAEAPMLVVRIRGGVEWARGSVATVAVDGPVVAWAGAYSSEPSVQP